jgi:group I intron endonuclease
VKRTIIPSTSGIYQIQSKINGKIYIGSAINFKTRRASHFLNLRKKIHANKYLQRHSNKHGIDNLQFSIIEFCAKEKLIEREQMWIDVLNPKFNLYLTAGSPLGVKRSEETKKRMKENHADFSGVNHPNYGKKLNSKGSSSKTKWIAFKIRSDKRRRRPFRFTNKLHQYETLLEYKMRRKQERLKQENFI